MSPDFDWRFSDGEDYAASRRPAPHKPRRRLWLAVLAVVILAGGSVSVWWRLNRDDLRQQDRQLQAVAELELSSITGGDVELYLSQQDGSNASWYRAQESLAREGILAPPPAPGLEVVSVAIEQARVLGDVGRVELVVTAASSGQELSAFSATRFYRQGSGARWLHAMPDAEYLGPVRVWLGENVRLVGYEADAEWLRPVASHLERTGRDICELIECQELPVTIVFTDTMGGSVPQDALPAPVVSGRPMDETAESIWRAALDELLLDRIIDCETGVSEKVLVGKPPSMVFIARRLRERIRVQIGLRPWIVLDTEPIGDALESGRWLTLADIEGFAGDVAEEANPLLLHEVDLFLTFVVSNYGERGVMDLLRAIPESGSLSDLVLRAFDLDLKTLDGMFLGYAEVLTGRSLPLDSD